MERLKMFSYYDNVTNKLEHGILVDTSFFVNGTASKIGAVDFIILCCIYSHMNSTYESYPSIRTIAKETGTSTTTVQKAIKELQEAGFFTVEKVKEEGSRYTHNIYKFVQPEDYKEVEDDDAVEKPFTARDYISLWCSKYSETFGHSYTPNYRKDCSMFKNKIMANYEQADIIKMLDILFTQYSRKWSKKGYEYPTIGAFCSWLYQECYREIQLNKDKEERMKEVARKAEDNDTMSKFMNM